MLQPVPEEEGEACAPKVQLFVPSPSRPHTHGASTMTGDAVEEYDNGLPVFRPCVSRRGPDSASASRATVHHGDTFYLPTSSVPSDTTSDTMSRGQRTPSEASADTQSTTRLRGAAGRQFTFTRSPTTGASTSASVADSTNTKASQRSCGGFFSTLTSVALSVGKRTVEASANLVARHQGEVMCSQCKKAESLYPYCPLTGLPHDAHGSTMGAAIEDGGTPERAYQNKMRQAYVRAAQRSPPSSSSSPPPRQHRAPPTAQRVAPTYQTVFRQRAPQHGNASTPTPTPTEQPVTGLRKGNVELRFDAPVTEEELARVPADTLAKAQAALWELQQSIEAAGHVPRSHRERTSVVVGTSRTDNSLRRLRERSSIQLSDDLLEAIRDHPDIGPVDRAVSIAGYALQSMTVQVLLHSTLGVYAAVPSFAMTMTMAIGQQLWMDSTMGDAGQEAAVREHKARRVASVAAANAERQYVFRLKDLRQPDARVEELDD